ncbi:hypothetical protein HYX16_06715 [Candidatus Woesearchaeota archaeon]|nr:hypothetical protein [Candidatus Woesearchaeota archaeon]
MKKESIENIYSRNYKFGIIGCGGLGLAVFKELIKKFTNSTVSLVPHDICYLELILPDLEIDIDGRNVSYYEIADRVNVYRSIDGLVKQKSFLDSDIIILAARNSKVSFKSFKEREDEYDANKEMLEEIGPRLSGYNGFFVNLTGPVELSCEKIHRESRIIREKISGVTFTDTLRFQKQLSNELREHWCYKNKRRTAISKALDDAVVIGEHGPNMVMIYSLIKIDGKRLIDDETFYTKRLKRSIIKKLRIDPTKLQTGGIGKNVDTPRSAVVDTVEALLKRETIPLASFSGEDNCFIANMSYSKLDDILASPIIARDESFMDKISDEERRRYFQSVEEVKKSLHKARLI